MKTFDNSDIEIPCPHCGKKTKKRLGGLKHDQDFTCPHCSQVSRIDTKGLTKGLKSVEDRLNNLRRTIGKLGK
jgi:transposase-like protein